MKINEFEFKIIALTNKGNCYFAEKEYDKARQYYEEALKIDASCVEALYNLGDFS
jgi:intraflagellar transport protein 88